jgi:dienelactone hydrolase
MNTSQMIQFIVFLSCSLIAKASIAQVNTPNTLNAEIVSVVVKASPFLAVDTVIPVHVFKPPQNSSAQPKETWPVVIFSHGRPASATARAAQKNPVNSEIVRYWHSRGYALVAAVRPGYGDNSSIDPEDNGSRWNGDNCTGVADFNKTANAASAAVKATHAWLESQSWVDRNRLLLVGQSVGGLTTVNACGQNWPGVMGCINFVGGAGGNPIASPGKSCQSNRLGDVLSNAAKTTTVPSIWLYSANDKYWGEEAPKTWFKAFQEAAKAAGQSVLAEFYAAPPVGDNGHSLQVMGTRFWVPVMNKWLDQNGF